MTQTTTLVGPVFTADPNQPWAQSITMRDQTIVAVGPVDDAPPGGREVAADSMTRR